MTTVSVDFAALDYAAARLDAPARDVAEAGRAGAALSGASCCAGDSGVAEGIIELATRLGAAGDRLASDLAASATGLRRSASEYRGAERCVTSAADP